MFDLPLPDTFTTWVSGIVAQVDLPAFFGQEAAARVTPITLIVVILMAAALSIPNTTWRWFGLFTTLVHELGHAFAGLLTGRIVHGITIRSDHSGSASSSGYGTFSAVVSGFFGYPAPALVGTALLWAVFNGYTSTALLIGTVIIAATILFIRNFVGILVIMVSAALSAALWYFATPEVQSAALLIIGVALLVGAVRGLITVVRVHTSHRDQLQDSDAYILATRTFIPSPVWLLAFTAVIGWSWWAAVVSYFG